MAAIEGGDQLDGSLEHLRAAYRRGVRSVGIVYDHHSSIGDGAMAMPVAKAAACESSSRICELNRRRHCEPNRAITVEQISNYQFQAL